MKHPMFYGDIHNHCDRSYAHGSLDNALQNGRLQLDFVSVTGHPSWPDIPESSGRLGALVEYHERGFKKLEDGWNDFVNIFEPLGGKKCTTPRRSQNLVPEFFHGESGDAQRLE